MKAIVILASCEFYFIRVNKKLVQHPSNNISNIKITTTLLQEIIVLVHLFRYFGMELGGGEAGGL